MYERELRSHQKVKTHNKSIDINKIMATKTMYQLMIKQQKYSMAYEILNVMSKSTKNKKFVKDELMKIKKKLNQGD